MDVRTFLRPWSGWVLRHIPANSPHGVLDFRYAGRAAGNRWNAQGEPTLYLAGDEGVAVAEFARHLIEDRRLKDGARLVERRVFRLVVDLAQTLDLREPALCQSLSLREAPYCFLDKQVARSVAAFLRRTTPAQGLFVPSVAFLDDPGRFVLAVFLEKLPRDPAQFILRAETGGLLRLDLSAREAGDQPRG